MLSISSGGSAGYLTGSVGSGRESYYTGAVTAGEPAGRWKGAGAEKLGLVGEIDHDVMHAVYERYADPRDQLFADAATRSEAGVLGRPPKNFKTPEQVVAARIEAYPDTPLPEQVQAWRIEAERDTPKAVLFYDLTYSPVKSVTVLHTAFDRAAAEARAAGDNETADSWAAKVTQIDHAIQSANSAMLDHMAQAAGYARTGRHGSKSSTGRWDDAHDWVVGSFYQHTSRDLDPQLHVHNAVLNRVECSDGQWRALDSRAIYAAKQGAGAIADRVLEVELTRRLGLSWKMRTDGIAREIDGVDQAAMDLFSSRSHTLTKRAEQLVDEAEERQGRQLNSLQRDRIRRRASMATRPSKTHDGESREEQLDRWDAELRTDVAGGLHRIADRFAETGAAEGAATEWVPSAVIAQAIEACHTGTSGDGRATFGRSELIRQIMLTLPDDVGDLTGQQVTELAERLADEALSGDGVVKTSGQELGTEPAASRLADGRAATIAPGSQRWAGTGHVEAEIALLRSAGNRGATHLDRAEVEAWLDGPGADLSAAQREAVAGLATSDAALTVLIGPAGTGKSFTAGALAALWEDHSDGGRVVGVATSELAANVLHDDGVTDTANITAFLVAQKRLSDGRPLPGDERCRLSSRDVLLVDEASMLNTEALSALQGVADGAGARVVLTGDPRQLGAVGAGGLMRTVVDRGAETYTLGEVRRFTADWERDASLQLREGEADVIAEYDRRGRILDGGNEAATVAAVARAAAADRLAGHASLVVAPSNRLAGEVAAGIRSHLVAAGVVQEHGVVLGRDGCTAGEGDIVQARRIDRGLGLTNRETYTVTEVGDGGGLSVVSTRTGELRQIPAEYVQADLSLAYAGTVHAAQGATVFAGHALVTPTMSRAAAYVAMSRGTDGNTAWCVTDRGDGSEPATGRGVLSGVMMTPDDVSEWSATDVAEADDARLRSAASLMALIEDETRLACRERLDADLDQLVLDGDLSELDRARFGADQGSEYLARLLRTHEQGGADPAEVLREAVASRSLASAISVAQVVAGRIDTSLELPVPQLDAEPPTWTAKDRREHLADLSQRLQDRQLELGNEAAKSLPPWSEALGPVPADQTDRAVWERRAGVIAAHRESSGWTSDQVPIGRCPGTSTPEKRAQWHEAYAAAGMPEERRPEAEMTDGRLLVRAAAAAREEAAAPEFVDDTMRDHYRAAAEAEREGILARSAGNEKRAAVLQVQAEEAGKAAQRLADVAELRGDWLAASLESREVGRAAREELSRRGLDPAAAPSRITAEDWLSDDRVARESDDQHRTVGELDLADGEAETASVKASAEPTLSGEAPAQGRRKAPSAAAIRAATSVVAAAELGRQQAREQLADRASQDTAEPTSEDAWEQQPERVVDESDDALGIS